MCSVAKNGRVITRLKRLSNLEEVFILFLKQIKVNNYVRQCNQNEIHSK